MKNYTIKPLKWEKYSGKGEDFVYCSKVFEENDDLTIFESGGVFEVTDHLNEKEYPAFKTLKAAKEKAQEIWEKELRKHLKEVK